MDADIYVWLKWMLKIFEASLKQEGFYTKTNHQNPPWDLCVIFSKFRMSDSWQHGSSKLSFPIFNIWQLSVGIHKISKSTVITIILEVVKGWYDQLGVAVHAKNRDNSQLLQLRSVSPLFGKRYRIMAPNYIIPAKGLFIP